MGFRVLVAYASWKGSTKEIAEKIGETLRDESIQVEVVRAKEVKSIAPYQAVVLGTGIHAGRCHSDAFHFAKKHREKLKGIPFALFVVCLTAKDTTSEAQCKVRAYLSELQKALGNIEPINIGLFGGMVNFKMFPWYVRWLLKKMKVPEGDFRDWKVIQQWARNLKTTLLNLHGSPSHA